MSHETNPQLSQKEVSENRKIQGKCHRNTEWRGHTRGKETQCKMEYVTPT